MCMAFLNQSNAMPNLDSLKKACASFSQHSARHTCRSLPAVGDLGYEKFYAFPRRYVINDVDAATIRTSMMRSHSSS